MPGGPNESAALYHACRRDGSAEQAAALQELGAAFYRIAYAMLRERPGRADLAADCMQLALIKVYQRIEQCREPEAFRGWAARVARRTVLDALRQSVATQAETLPDDRALPPSALAAAPSGPDELALLLRSAIASAPLSERSRRVVVGRFFEERDDYDLARAESVLAAQTVLPSHVQVTRAKNLAKLRADTLLLEQLRELTTEC
jgi:RNA polymerase sigma factor (sigma-70 family)